MRLRELDSVMIRMVGLHQHPSRELSPTGTSRTPA